MIDDILEFVGEKAAPEYPLLYFPILFRCAVESTPLTAQVRASRFSMNRELVVKYDLVSLCSLRGVCYRE